MPVLLHGHPPLPALPATKPTQRKKSERTRLLLDFHTYNEARRAKLKRVLDVLTRFLDRERGYGPKRVRAELVDDEPHRAIVRDLILDAEADLHIWSPLLRKAMRVLPDLKAWALAPLTAGVVPAPAPTRTRRA